MESLKNVISSFNTQKSLNPKIWINNGDKLSPKVRRNLLEIAYQFIDSFGLDVLIDDIIITGSIANYNWSKYSDIDLHIVIDYQQFSSELKDLYLEFFDLKKSFPRAPPFGLPPFVVGGGKLKRERSVQLQY
jgi:hypothetical protein